MPAKAGGLFRPVKRMIGFHRLLATGRSSSAVMPESILAERREPAMRVIAKPAFSTRSRNPYNWLLYTHMVSAGIEVHEYTRRRVLGERYDIWHLHWPEMHLNDDDSVAVFRRSFTTIALLQWVRLRGTRIVWTVHNLRAHEQQYPKLERWFWSAFIRQLDAYICMSESGREAALERFPLLRTRPGYVIPHGHYRDVYPNDTERDTARGDLGIAREAKVLTYVGQIRQYKNLPSLIAAFRKVSDPDLILLIAGRPWSAEMESHLRELVRDDARIRLYPEFLSDEDLQLYLNAADAVVLPYREILNSGTALLSLSFNRPVLVTSSGSTRELQATIGPAWVRTYSGELTAHHLQETVRWARETPRGSSPPLDLISWERIAAATVEAFQTVRYERGV